jgi:hypothetical protein
MSAARAAASTASNIDQFMMTVKKVYEKYGIVSGDQVLNADETGFTVRELSLSPEHTFSFIATNADGSRVSVWVHNQRHRREVHYSDKSVRVCFLQLLLRFSFDGGKPTAPPHFSANLISGSRGLLIMINSSRKPLSARCFLVFPFQRTCDAAEHSSGERQAVQAVVDLPREEAEKQQEGAAGAVTAGHRDQGHRERLDHSRAVRGMVSQLSVFSIAAVRGVGTCLDVLSCISPSFTCGSWNSDLQWIGFLVCFLVGFSAAGSDLWLTACLGRRPTQWWSSSQISRVLTTPVWQRSTISSSARSFSSAFQQTQPTFCNQKIC